MENNPPVNAYDGFEGHENISSQYANNYVVSNSSREIFLTFGSGSPPDKKFKIIARIILNPLTTQELILALQNHLQKLKDDNENPPTPKPRK